MEHLLLEHIGGFELFELKEFEKLSGATYTDYLALSQVVNHISSFPISDSSEAISELKNLQEGILSECLKNFLQINNVKILNCDKSLKNSLQDIGIVQKFSPNISRGVKLNLKKFLKRSLNKQLTLAVSHSLAKETIKYSLEREDNVAISTGYEIEHLEDEILCLNEKVFKLLNWYFPFVKEILKENTGVLLKILNSQFEQIEKDTIPELILEEIKSSLSEVPEEDLNIMKETLHVIQEKKNLLMSLELYLSEKLKVLAPNLREILGDRLSFKMIHKAGGMMNLSLYPSSTLQLLGAEKSLFRSLKMKRNTPKYGLIYHLNYLKENQGRMCRSIASKCSLAARIDCFNESRSNEYGKELRKNIDKKINSYKSKNSVETSSDILKRVYKKLNNKNDMARGLEPANTDKLDTEATNQNQKKFKSNTKVSKPEEQKQKASN